MRDPEEWNALVASLPIHSLMQSRGWAAVQEALGFRPEAVALQRDGRLEAAALCVRRPLPGGFHGIYVPRGPALRAPEVLAGAARALARRDPGAVYVRVEPECPAEDLGALPHLRPAFSPLPEFTYRLDLSGGRAAALARIPRQARYLMRLGPKRGLEIGEEEDAGVLHDLLLATRRRVGRLAIPSREECHRFLALLRQPQGGARLLVARHQGRPVAALLLAWFGQRGYGFLTANDAEAAELRPTHALHARALDLLAEQGQTLYDLHGVPGPPGVRHSASGLGEFKRRFGGPLVRFARLDQPGSWLYGPFHALETARDRWLRRRRR